MPMRRMGLDNSRGYNLRKRTNSAGRDGEDARLPNLKENPVTPDEREALANAAYEHAYDLDVKYGCCPQCVLTAVKEATGDVSDDVIKAGHGLSGGGALIGTGGVCGALTGGLLALGTRLGREAAKLDQGRGMSNFQAGRAHHRSHNHATAYTVKL